MKKCSIISNGTLKLKNDIDTFFDLISDSPFHFERYIKTYLQNGPEHEELAEIRDNLSKIETRGDKLRRKIETYLYQKTLIPNLRSDVLELLEGLDQLINIQESTSYNLYIEKPYIPGEFHQNFFELQQLTARCIEAVVQAARCFFRERSMVRDHCHKTIMLESMADKESTKLKQAVFASELALAEKMHVRYFVERIDLIANCAEDIADRLSIISIKHSI